MANAVSAAIMGGSGLLSSVGGILGASASTRKQYKYQSRLQQQQQAWLESMSNTAHQREVADLKEAGLNPILSVMGGSGASTPSAGMGQINAPDYGSSVQEGIATALQVKQTKAQTKLMDEQAKTETQKRDNFEADTALKRAEKVGREIENSNLPTMLKAKIKNMLDTGKAALGMSTAAQLNAATQRMIAPSTIESNKENARYNKERARGYSESYSNDSNKNVGMHIHGFNSGSGTSSSYSRTY